MEGLGNFGAVRAHRVLVDAFGRRIVTLTLPGLIRAKRAAGREKDRLALPDPEGPLETSDGENGPL